jgi:hypothetical protein
LPADEPEAEVLGQLPQSINVAIAEASETKTLVPQRGSSEPLIRPEDEPCPSKELPAIVASTFPEPRSSAEPEISLIDVQDNNFSADAQIGTNTNVDSNTVSPVIFSVKVAGAQGIVL